MKGTDAQESGIRCIAYLISNTVASLIFGAIVTGVGYYTPFIWLGTARKLSVLSNFALLIQLQSSLSVQE